MVNQVKHNFSLPQAQCFFVYILWSEEEDDPLQTHVVFGWDKKSTEKTRGLICSGCQTSELLYLGPVVDLRPHHYRSMKAILQETNAQSTELPAIERCPSCQSMKKAVSLSILSKGEFVECNDRWHSLMAAEARVLGG